MAAECAMSPHRSIISDLGIRPDKVGHILNGWKLKYSGTGVPIDAFIYRVGALTHQTLDGNFAVLCRNVSVLFEGKATEFCWRYHKSVAEVRWDRLCSALRLQFRQNRDDVDVAASSSSEVEINADIEALALVCWNCHHEEHRYQDCLEEKQCFVTAVEQLKPTNPTVRGVKKT